MLAASVPLFEDDFAYFVSEDRLPDYEDEFALYVQSRIAIVFIDDILFEKRFIALNEAEGYGFLRVMDLDERPNPRDVVIYEALPNELPRVAGIITTVPQTPLSHVNLRALQDRIPNAFIRGVVDDDTIDSLIDSHVRYTVTRGGYTIRAATKAEVDAHYEASRPATAQMPERDLSVTEITALSDVEFDDWTAFGVKAANVAVLGTLGFPDGTVPDGFAVPFYFYDEFMKANDLYTTVSTMLADTGFQTDYNTQEDELKKLRKAIKNGTTPEWIITALEEMHEEFPDGTSLRYRSSTNNEDLPGFSGAGLYDSKTQDPDETEEDGIDKSIKGVWASLWNFRAFVERDFHRVDHLTTAMGVLVHPNYSDELANGVAVSHDPIGGREGAYYVNTQVGEDLVTNPEANSAPEAVMLLLNGRYEVLVYSNQVDTEQLLMSDAQMAQLRTHLTVIHDKFEELYDPEENEPFAMEIEFKITSANILAIKQARPWVFNVVSKGESPSAPPPRPSQPSLPTTSGGGGGGGGGGFGPAPVAPKFVDGFRATRAVAENARPVDAIGDPVSATHPDELEITYSLSGTDAASFAVDEETGQISVKAGMDLTIGNTYTVNLTATDSAGFGAITIVMIELGEAIHHHYDLNRNGKIERDEVIAAVKDYFDGNMTKDEVIELIKLYFAAPA